jgi:hypothetical protein
MAEASKSDLRKGQLVHVRNITLTLIERADDTRRGPIFWFISQQCHANLRGWGYIFIAGQGSRAVARVACGGCVLQARHEFDPGDRLRRLTLGFFPLLPMCLQRLGLVQVFRSSLRTVCGVCFVRELGLTCTR